MLRLNKAIKGLIVDYDSFPDIELGKWLELDNLVKCYFVTSIENHYQELVTVFDNTFVESLRPGYRFFFPSPDIHKKAITVLNSSSLELVYFSSDYDIIKRANGYYSGTILLSDETPYELLSNSPDMICESIDHLINNLKEQYLSFYGEAKVNGLKGSKGYICNCLLETDEYSYELYSLGRYYGNNTYLHGVHPYTAAIYSNKNTESKSYGKFNTVFGSLYSTVIKKIIENNHIDGICSVPAKPNKTDRFEIIRKTILSECNLDDYSSEFTCIKDYGDQKGKSALERINSVNGAYKFHGSLEGKTVVLIDDIITTKSTINECVKELYAANANRVVVVVLAINQQVTSFCLGKAPNVRCLSCEETMRVQINSSKLDFFFRCSKCSATLDYMDGIELLSEDIDNCFDFDKETSVE